MSGVDKGVDENSGNGKRFVLRVKPPLRLVPPPLLLNMSRGGDQTGVARTAGVPNILFFPIFVMPNACSVAASTSSGRFRFRAIKSISDRYEPVPEGLIWGLILPVDRFDMAAASESFVRLASRRLFDPTATTGFDLVNRLMICSATYFTVISFKFPVLEAKVSVSTPRFCSMVTNRLQSGWLRSRLNARCWPWRKPPPASRMGRLVVS